MEKKSNFKICIICKKTFEPNPKVGDRQKACNELSCQQKHKKLSQQRWLSSNPDYFKGRYPLLKEKILKYQQEKRFHKNDCTVETCHTIQDELTCKNNKRLQPINIFSAIQDELTLLITNSKKQILFSEKWIYKTS